MPTPVFPHVLTTGDEQDSKKFAEEYDDPSDARAAEGGYSITRAKFTRAPRRVWTSGFTFINTTAKNELEAFWKSVRGSSTIFQWRNPADDQDYLVRFKAGSSMTFAYEGAGLNQRWEVAFTVVET